MGSLAERMGARVTFRQDDILASWLDPGFDAILDRGCFHVLDPEARPAYVRTVHRLLRPAAFFFLKVFSHLEERENGPHRFSRSEISSAFDERFEIIGIAQGERR